MDLQANLKQLGLNHSEITVYLWLLENGLSTPPTVARETKIARTNCYNILNDLVDKGLVETLLAKKHKAYRAHDPEMLLHLLDVRKEAARRILPELQGIYRSNKHKPKVEFYDGLEEVQKIFLQSLEARSVVAVGAENFLPSLGDFYSMYQNEIAKRGIAYTALPLAIAQDIVPLQQIGGAVPNVPRATVASTILIWDTNVAFITLDAPVFGTVLMNEAVARSMGLLIDHPKLL